MGKMKKKYQSGEGARYMTRNKALKYLQLSLKDFRRLCILKGVYPREPRNRKKAQKGDTSIHTLYLKKDIQFLAHEPNIWKIREFKTIFKKINRARTLREKEDVVKLRENMPVMKLDHIVKERYPTFIDALRDLDDCLTLLFLFATLPSLYQVPVKIGALCRRLTVEFMHYVIAAKALRKVFISIKGFYYQAEIKGHAVTWVVPHQFSYNPEWKEDVDFEVMTNFVDFYTIMLGFVNFRLYHSVNMVYPPTFPGHSVTNPDNTLVDDESYISERIAALNIDLARQNAEPDEEEDGVDEFPMVEDQEKLEELKREAERIKKLKSLFKGLKFFINREVPREPLVFIIRCLGGDVSWDKVSFVGATYDETDESITHQIADRRSIDKQYISRYYIQPQWVFDSVNARELLPVEKYFLGVVLPPHLSPFHDEHKLDHYKPPEEKALTDPEVAAQLENRESEDEDSEEVGEGTDDQMEEEEEAGGERTSRDQTQENEGEEEEEDMDEVEKERLKKKKMMSVKAGQVTKEDPNAPIIEAKQDYRLREKLVRNKYRMLYKSMMKGRRERNKEAWLLDKKRKRIDEEEKTKRKAEKKEKKKEKIAEVSTSV